MDVDPNLVIDILLERLGTAERENAFLKALVVTLQTPDLGDAQDSS